MGCSVAWKCFVAWRLGLWSQQPTCPQIRHSLRCIQVSPVLRQSSQPCADGSTSFIWLVWLHCCWNICKDLLVDLLLRLGPFCPRVGPSSRPCVPCPPLWSPPRPRSRRPGPQL